MRKKTVIAICISFSAGLLLLYALISQDLELSQELAYADMAFTEFYDGDLRSQHFDQVQSSYESELLKWLGADLTKTLNVMHKRVLGEISLSASYLDEFRPFDDGGLYHLEADRHELYPHTAYFERLAKWGGFYGYITAAEKRKVQSIASAWQNADNEASEFNLDHFLWHRSSHRKTTYRGEEREIEYQPQPERSDIVYPLVSHYTKLIDSLNSVESVFIDFAKDPNTLEIKLFTRELKGVVPESMRVRNSSEQSISLTSTQMNTAEILKELRECTFAPINQNDIEQIPKTSLCLKSDYFEMYLFSENITYIIWRQASSSNDIINHQQGFFLIDPDKGKNLTELLTDLIMTLY